MANTILLKGRGIRHEADGAEIIMPGMLLAMNNAGEFIKHATAGGACVPRFAVENDLEGKEISDAYAKDDYVQAEILHSGMEVLAFIKAEGAAVVIGDLLESAGGGHFQKFTSGRAMLEALEAVDNSGNAASAARIKARVI